MKFHSPKHPSKFGVHRCVALEERLIMNIVLTVIATTMLAIMLPAVIYVAGRKISGALSWTERAYRGREYGEWLIEAMLVQAYREKWGMRPAFLKWYLRAVIVVRTAWLIGASATIAAYITKWLPDWFAWPYWAVAVAIIAMSLTRDAMRMKQWRTTMSNRYHPLEDLPFH